MNTDTVIARLRQRIKSAGSLRKAASEMGVSASLLSYIMTRRCEPTPKVLEAMGIDRVTMYRERS